MVGGVTARRVLRFKQRLQGDDVPSVPARFRGGPNGPSGRVARLWLSPADGATWLEIEQGGLPWRRESSVIPLGDGQPTTPPEHAIELHAGMRAVCHEGYVGELEGLSFDADSGTALYLLVRIRRDVGAVVFGNSHPYRHLLPLSGQLAQVSPSWVTRAHGQNGNGSILHLDASLEQIASSDVVRSDGELAAEIGIILSQNPAAEPLLSRIEIEVQDGNVSLRGEVPSLRHRASIEQDIWHVPGVFTVHNELRVG